MSTKNIHTNLTTLSPIEFRPNDPDGRVEGIKDLLSKESKKEGADQLLRSCPMVHMARAQVIENLIPAMGLKPADSLKSSYLLMVAEIDGEIDDFIDCLYNGPPQVFNWKDWVRVGNRHADFVHSLWGRCIGYPDRTGSVFLRHYLHRCRIKITLPFAAYDHTVEQIQASKKRQTEFSSFVEQTQDMSANDLHAHWHKYRNTQLSDTHES